MIKLGGKVVVFENNKGYNIKKIVKTKQDNPADYHAIIPWAYF